MDKPRNTFVICFRIAKKNCGVLYWHENGHYSYSPVRDLWGEPLIDFRPKATSKRRYDYGKELSNEDRMKFYNVTK